MKINKVLLVIMAILLPYVILMGGVRLVMNPGFPGLEYRRVGFPEDPHGFNLLERTKWSEYTVSYLINDEDISYLGNLQDASGGQFDRHIGLLLLGNRDPGQAEDEEPG